MYAEDEVNVVDRLETIGPFVDLSAAHIPGIGYERWSWFQGSLLGFNVQLVPWTIIGSKVIEAPPVVCKVLNSIGVKKSNAT